MGFRGLARNPDACHRPRRICIARVESDCFAVLLPRIAQEWQAARQAADILEALSEPVRIDQMEFSVGASVGIAFNQGDTATTSDILLRDALRLLTG